MPDEIIQVQLTEDGTRPVDLPEKFATIKDMVAAYSAAEAKITELSQQSSTQQQQQEQKPKPASTADDDVISKLPPEQQAALRTIADFNVAQRISRLTEKVGADGLKAVNEFIGGATIPADVKAGYEAALASGNEALIDANFNLVVAHYEAANGELVPAKNVVAGASATMTVPAGTKPFESLAQQLAAQKDEKYYTDSAFRKQVEDRIAISPPYPAQ